MEQQADELRKRVALLTNVYGFTARHYIRKDSSLNFIIGLHRVIVIEGWNAGSEELKNEILDFVERYNELNSAPQRRLHLAGSELITMEAETMEPLQ